MLKFKKTLLTCSIAASLTFTSVTAYAGDECAADFRSVMRNYAEAQRVQDYAISSGMLKQSESVMALTCFDDLVARTSRAGDIFSDVLPDAAMATWGAVAYDVAGITNGIGLYHSTIGITNRLGFDLSYVVSDQLKAFLDDNFNPVSGPSRLESLAGNAYGALSTWFDDIDAAVGSLGLASYMAIYNGVQTQMASANYNCSNLQTFWDDAATRQGIADEIPHMSYDELVAVSYPTGGPHPAGQDDDYDRVFTANSGLMTAAQNDLTEMENTTETYDFERTMPTTLTVTSSVADVIAQM